MPIRSQDPKWRGDGKALLSCLALLKYLTFLKYLTLQKYLSLPRRSVQQATVMNLNFSHLESPLGDLVLVTDASMTIRALDFADRQGHLHRGLREQYGSYRLTASAAPAVVVDAMTRYFDGELDALASLPTATQGSALQHRVWAALRDIPAGTTTSYGRLAKALGFDDPRAAIDIGAANGANPIAIIVPCHRVIASDGGLKGYAGGLPRKRWLLEHEQALAPASPTEVTKATKVVQSTQTALPTQPTQPTQPTLV